PLHDALPICSLSMLLQRYEIALGFPRLVVVVLAEPPKKGTQRNRIFKHCTLASFHDCSFLTFNHYPLSVSPGHRAPSPYLLAKGSFVITGAIMASMGRLKKQVGQIVGLADIKSQNQGQPTKVAVRP